MEKARASQILQSKGWLSRQSEEFRAELIRRSHLKIFEAGATIYHPGAPRGGLYGLAVGALSVSLANGRVSVVAHPPAWFGEAAALGLENRLVGLTAVERSHLLHLPLAEFERLIARPEHCRSVALLAVEHLQEALDAIIDLMANDPEQKLARRLLALAESEAAQSDGLISATQSALAQMSALSRQTVNAVLARLAARGAVELSYGKVKITNIGVLRELVGRPEPKN